MNQIVLNVDNRYIAEFLNFLKILHFVKVQKVKKSDTSDFLQKDEQTSKAALLYAAKPIRSSVTLAQLAQEQGYVKTDWHWLNQLAKDRDIQEPM